MLNGSERRIGRKYWDFLRGRRVAVVFLSSLRSIILFPFPLFIAYTYERFRCFPRGSFSFVLRGDHAW